MDLYIDVHCCCYFFTMAFTPTSFITMSRSVRLLHFSFVSFLVVHVPFLPCSGVCIEKTEKVREEQKRKNEGGMRNGEDEPCFFPVGIDLRIIQM